MAAELLKQKPLWHRPEILSRGVSVLFPEPMNQKAEAVLISNGIQMGNFTSKALTEEDFGEDTLVITFETAIRETIETKFPKAKNLYVLTDITGDELEIFDPCGQEIVTYGLCYEAIEKTVTKLAEVLNEGDFFREVKAVPQGADGQNGAEHE
jgi:protein-tyrosine-phosphatase